MVIITNYYTLLLLYTALKINRIPKRQFMLSPAGFFNDASSDVEMANAFCAMTTCDSDQANERLRKMMLSLRLARHFPEQTLHAVADGLSLCGLQQPPPAGTLAHGPAAICPAPGHVGVKGWPCRPDPA